MADIAAFVPPSREQRALAELHRLLDQVIRSGATEVGVAAVFMALGESASAKHPHLYRYRPRGPHGDRSEPDTQRP